MPVSAILLAGGLGLRSNSSIPKQFILLGKKPLALYSLEVFLSLDDLLQELVVVCDPSYQSLFPAHPKVSFATPGKERQYSAYAGFLKLQNKENPILFHDAARPFVKKEDILNLIKEGSLHHAAVLATPVSSTIKKACPLGLVEKTLERSTLWEMQTPQYLSYDIAKRGFEKALSENLLFTDDVSLAEALGCKVKLVKGSFDNQKITTPYDIQMAQLKALL